MREKNHGCAAVSAPSPTTFFGFALHHSQSSQVSSGIASINPREMIIPVSPYAHTIPRGTLGGIESHGRKDVGHVTLGSDSTDARHGARAGCRLHPGPPPAAGAAVASGGREHASACPSRS
jgi:hypothetical protein